MTTDTLTPLYHFPTVVYTIDKPDFLPAVRSVSDHYLAARRAADDPPLDPMWPVQTNGYAHEPALSGFTSFIAQSAWSILADQGYAMNDLEVYFSEMWTQEHRQYNGHEEHIHNNGAQITGVYFLDCPADGCKVAIHDPRYGKNQINLPEADLTKITTASSTALFIPEPGRMYFFNSWLPHSITRNPLTEPTTLVHFNLNVRPVTNKAAGPAPESNPNVTVI